MMYFCSMSHNRGCTQNNRIWKKTNRNSKQYNRSCTKKTQCCTSRSINVVVRKAHICTVVRILITLMCYSLLSCDSCVHSQEKLTFSGAVGINSAFSVPTFYGSITFSSFTYVLRKSCNVYSTIYVGWFDFQLLALASFLSKNKISIFFALAQKCLLEANRNTKL